MSYNADFQLFNSINGNSGSSSRSIPLQTLPNSKKNKGWQKATMDALETEGIRQLRKNYVFADARKMTQGEFVYRAVDIEDNPMGMPWFDKAIRKLRQDVSIPTYIKHFDFIGIIVNAITGVYDDMDDLYRVESFDEYSTNEYIRFRTEKLHEYAQAVFKAEIDRMLISKGINPNKQDFQSEEEKQQYLQELDAQVKALTPVEIEKNLSKNFKVMATEWAQNTLNADKERFSLHQEDRKALTDYILTGRFFRHYKVGYDYYDIERWLPEEVFFSQDVDCEYPQDGDYVGKITSMSISQILQRYGHQMNTKEQEMIGNYWNQTDDKSDYSNSGKNFIDNVFPRQLVTPFHNYTDHQLNLQMEEALGVPLGRTMDNDGNVSENWMPREENDYQPFHAGNYSSYLREDIDVRQDTIRVMECYWRSMKRIGVLIYENELGSMEVEMTTDDLLPEFLTENEIKKLRNLSLEELQKAFKDGNLEEYKNTITYHYVPEIWHGIKIKGNSAVVKEDIYLDVKPLDYQIKGDSEFYQVRIPVGGIITNGIVTKILPYQQLHNICMNQNTELLEKELGIFFTFDITGLPSEYQDETTEESVYRVRNVIKDTALFGVDLSRQNTQNNTTYPNIFQKHEVVFAQQVQYRQQMAEFYKQEAFNQIGITAQLLGAPNKYTNSEAIQTQAQASYALLNSLIEKFNTAKAKSNELHIAIAQFCETKGKGTILTRKGDGEIAFIDILAEDPDLFPLRRLSILPVTNTKDRKIVKVVQDIILNDNTMTKDFGDVIDLMTNPVILELQQKAKEMRIRSDKKVEEQRQFEADQNDKQIKAVDDRLQADRDLKVTLQKMDDDSSERQSFINSLGRDANSTKEDNFVDLTSAYKQTRLDANNEVVNGLKSQELDMKDDAQKEATRIAWQKLANDSEALRLKNKALDISAQNAIINKN